MAPQARQYGLGILLILCCTMTIFFSKGTVAEVVDILLRASFRKGPAVYSEISLQFKLSEKRALAGRKSDLSVKPHDPRHRCSLRSGEKQQGVLDSALTYCHFDRGRFA